MTPSVLNVFDNMYSTSSISQIDNIAITVKNKMNTISSVPTILRTDSAMGC